MKYPTKETVVFLLCEDIREEPGGKVSLMGVFSGGTITVAGKPPPGQSLIMQMLSIFVSFLDGEGTFKSTITVTDPDKLQIVNSGPSDALKNPDGPMNFILKLAPFPVKFGSYILRILLDNTPYEWAFSVIKGPDFDKP